MIANTRVRWRLPAIAVTLVMALSALAGCGSSSKNSSSASSGNAASSTSSSATTAASSSGASGAVVAGVPTLAQLTGKGQEEQPPSSSPPPAKGKSVWWISCGQSAPPCSSVSSAAGAAAKVLGLNFHIADANLGIGGGYIKAMDTAIAAHPAAIIVHGIDCSNIEQPLRQAKADHIIVMGVESIDCSDSGGPKLFTANMEYNAQATSSAAYFQDWGKISADTIIDMTDGKAKVLDAYGVEGLFADVDSGFRTELKKCSGCSIAGDFTFTPADEIPNGPYVQSLRAAALKYSDANAVFTSTDPAAEFGAPIAHSELPKAVNVGGSGEVPDLALIRQGIMTAATGAHDATWMGWAAMDEINRALDGKPQVPEGVGFRVITKSNLPPAGQGYVSSVPYKADYTKIWAAAK